MGGGKLKWCQLAHHQLMSQPISHLCPHSTAKANSEKTRMKKLMMMMKMIIITIIMNKSQETTVFHGSQKLTSAMKLRPEK